MPKQPKRQKRNRINLSPGTPSLKQGTGAIA
jgi:hypothetical protein